MVKQDSHMGSQVFHFEISVMAIKQAEIPFYIHKNERRMQK